MKITPVWIRIFCGIVAALLVLSGMGSLFYLAGNTAPLL